MQNIQVHCLPGGCNSYLFARGNRAVLVDAGNQSVRLLGFARAKGLSIVAILITHCHYDHLTGLEAIRKATNAPVYVHHADAQGLSDPAINLSYVGGGSLTSGAPDHLLYGSETLMLCDIAIDVHHTPGHTPGCVCYATKAGVFTGDFLFNGSIGRMDLPGGDETLMRTSLLTLRSWNLPPDMPLYPGHGEPTTYGHEWMHNPYIRRL